MGERKTNYSSDWEKRYTWIKNVKKDASLAFCKLCDKTFRVDDGGISQVTSHVSGQLHFAALKLNCFMSQNVVLRKINLKFLIEHKSQ